MTDQTTQETTRECTTCHGPLGANVYGACGVPGMFCSGECLRATLLAPPTPTGEGSGRGGAQFRKKPVVIEAVQWFKNGDHPLDFADLRGEFRDGAEHVAEGRVVRYFRRPDRPGDQPCEHASCGRPMHDHGWIDTLEGGHIVCPGDWIITGVRGEMYPCKPDIFAATYEPAEVPTPPASRGTGVPTWEGSGRGVDEQPYQPLPLEGGPTLAQMASDGPAIVGILNPDEDPVELFRQNLAFGEGKVWAVYLPEHPLSQWDDPQRPDHAVLAAITGNGPTSQANAEFLSWCLTHKRAIVAMERARDEACAALKEANDALRSIAGLPDDADAEDARIAALAAAEQGERDREDAERRLFLAPRMSDERLAQVTEIAGRYASTMATIASELADALRVERDCLAASHRELDRAEAELFRYRHGIAPEQQRISRFEDPTHSLDAARPPHQGRA